MRYSKKIGRYSDGSTGPKNDRGFERMIREPISAIDTGTVKGKHQRGELLVLLKYNAGLKYREIAQFDIFSDLSFASLRTLYRNKKKKKAKDPAKFVTAPIILDHNRMLVDAEIRGNDRTWHKVRLWVDSGNPDSSA
jgi:hypothetical protein